MKTGILLLDKPDGMSSAKAIAIVKRKLSLEKIGHAGTLDPFATGLLICLAGRATKVASYAESGRKEYTGTFLLGRVTTSDDITGQTISDTDSVPDFEIIQTMSARFTGEIEQTPPKVSAINVNGQRAYDLARRGIDVELKSRKVTVLEFALSPLDSRRVSFRIVCSKGTYIRSLARDLGEILGCGGCVETLRRTGSHPFSIEQATGLEDLKPESLLPWEILFPDTKRIKTDLARELQRGNERALIKLAAEFPNDLSKVIYQDPDSGENLGLLVRDQAKNKFVFAMSVLE